MGFEAHEALPGVFHIRDAMGVCMTLVTGEKRALLVDTGYGLEDVASFVKTLTDKPVTVLLTHHHFDHALGARWFERVLLAAPDMGDYPLYTGDAQRRRVLAQAQAKGLSPAGDFLGDAMPQPDELTAGDIDLGGLTARVILCPSHTPGSAVVYIPERRLLLTGDTWNPCTWLFFKEAVPVLTYRENARALLALPFEHVLCAHQPHLYPRAAFESAMNALTDEALDAAPRVTITPYEHIDTHQADLGDGCILVFDRAKYDCERSNPHEHL